MTQYLTIQQAAETLSVSQATVRRLVNRGCIQAVDVSGGIGKHRITRISTRSLDDYLSGCAILTPLPVRTAKPTNDYRLPRKRA